MKTKVISQGQELFKTMPAMPLVAGATLAAGALLAAYPVKFSLIAVVVLLFAVLAVKYPEACFALFLTAGLYKGDPRFSLPYDIDLTVFLGILTAAGILLRMFRKRITFTVPPFKMLFPFMVISCLSALSLTYTMAPIYGAAKLSRFATLTALAFFAPLYLFQERERFRNFVIAYVSVTMTVLLDMLQKGWLNPELTEVNSYEYLIVGYGMAAAFLMILLYLFMIDGSRVRRTFYLAILCPATIYGLMISGARGPLISLLLTLIIIPIVSRRPHAESGRLKFWVFLALIVGGAYIGFRYQHFARMTDRLMDLGGGSAMERVYMAKAALQALFTMPYLLTGLGTGGFSVYYRGFDGVIGEYPHNILLELATDIGIAGLTAGVLLIAWSFKKAYRAIKRTTGKDYYVAVCSASILLFTFLNALKTGDLNDNRLFFAMIGFIFYSDSKARAKGIVDSTPRGAK